MFQKGVSGNPGGRPKVAEEVRKLAKSHTLEAVGALANIANSKDADPRARVAAASALLDCAYGRLAQVRTVSVS